MQAIGSACRAARISSAVLLATVVVSLGLCSSASASWFEFSGSLSAKAWTTNGRVESIKNIWAQEYQSGLSVCVGPVQHTGSGYVFPYGWQCAGGSGPNWEFPAIVAAPGVDNPNSKSIVFRAVGS